MSADNYIGVYHDKREGHNDWVVAHGFMSTDDYGSVITRLPTRGAALEAAHDEVVKLPIVEYGVIELEPREE